MSDDWLNKLIKKKVGLKLKAVPRAEPLVVGAEAIEKNQYGWHISLDLGTRRGTIVEREEVLDTAKDYNTLSRNDAVFLDDILARDHVIQIGDVLRKKDENAGFLIGYWHDPQKNVGIIARYVHMIDAAGDVYGYGMPNVVEGDDIGKVYRLIQIPKKLKRQRARKANMESLANMPLGNHYLARQIAEVLMLGNCNVQPNFTSLFSFGIAAFTCAISDYRYFTNKLGINMKINSDPDEAIARLEKEQAEARAVKQVSGRDALDYLHRVYDKK
ncbi:hypothetical protein HN695_02675 [Candidatus Woesearchaeota archaeon]|jgi:hypothetical protein|nr:hypothetical protein [Candidatus Woesearchaeota archaeon]MBT5271981.1 hypothetical protein [Candidatus Woesearchaeota archaeon]MBT6040899.1 hypothetical protein [Candidatus Woesearchaeota archaeon]MBT6336763.1 hypothetical protein [Candidatus Woesearchaeota archaeon]MBT7927216.1 hypothetical protein [Candidatus Woesearchaeota archaeon]